MMMPSIFGENLFDDWMDFPFDNFDRAFWGGRNPLYGKHAKNMMKTDVRETDAGYEVDIDLPGFKKEEIRVCGPLRKSYGKNQRWIRPEPSPPASFSTSDTVTML